MKDILLLLIDPLVDPLGLNVSADNPERELHGVVVSPLSLLDGGVVPGGGVGGLGLDDRPPLQLGHGVGVPKQHDLTIMSIAS